VLLLGCWLGLSACGPLPAGPQYDRGNGDEDLGAADATGVSPDSGFALLCTGIQSADSLNREIYGEFMDRFCTGTGAPTALLATTLPARAFIGNGEPRLTALAEVTDDPVRKTTAIRVAAGVLIPGRAADYFTKISAYMNDPALAAADGVRLIDGIVEDVILKKDDGDGKARRSGVERSLKIENKVSGQTITSAYEQRQDLWEFVPGKAYLITSHLTKSVSGVTGATLFSALVEHNDKTYVTAQIFSESSNRGQPAIAEETLLKVVRSGIRNILTNANRFAEPVAP